MTESQTPKPTGLVLDKRIPPKLDDIYQKELNFDFLVANELLMPQLPWNETQRDVLRQRIKDDEQREKGRAIREELLSAIAFRNKRLDLLCWQFSNKEDFTNLKEKFLSQIFLKKFSLFSKGGRRSSLHSLESMEREKIFQTQRARFLEELKDITDLELRENRLFFVKLYKSIQKKLLQEWNLREYKKRETQLEENKTKFYDFWNLKSIETFTTIYFLSEEEKKKLPSTKFLSTANVLRLVHSWQIREEAKILLEATLKKSGLSNPDFWPKLDFLA